MRGYGPGGEVARGKRAAGWLAAIVVLALVGGAVAWYYRLDERYLPDGFGWLEPSGSANPTGGAPTASATPDDAEGAGDGDADDGEGLDLGVVPSPEPLASPAPAGAALDEEAVRRALAPHLNDRDLGRSFGVLVTGPSGDEAFTSGPRRVIPASTTKLLTAVAALVSLGPERRFSTKVVQGRGDAEIVLVGGGDPYLAGRAPAAGTWPERADLGALADETARSLAAAGRDRVRLSFDASLFSGPSVAATWEPNYVPDGVVAPISALWVDRGVGPGGYGKAENPPALAAATFAAALEARGIEVTGRARSRTASSGAEELGRVDGPTVAEIVERVIEVSDNEAAEVLAHHVGLSERGAATFDDGAAATMDLLAGLGVDLDGSRLYDGSGLSRANRLSVHTIADTLRVAARPEKPELRPAISGLPVGGFNGSLTYRFGAVPTQSLGRIRAKTGTLTGVSGLAGIVVDAEGSPLVFVMVADRVRAGRPGAGDVRLVIDDLVASLATCHCSDPDSSAPPSGE